MCRKSWKRKIGEREIMSRLLAYAVEGPKNLVYPNINFACSFSRKCYKRQSCGKKYFIFKEAKSLPNSNVHLVSSSCKITSTRFGNGLHKWRLMIKICDAQPDANNCKFMEFGFYVYISKISFHLLAYNSWTKKFEAFWVH